MQNTRSQTPSASAPSIAVIGTGPAGLMAADLLSRSGARVVLLEKRKAIGRKLLVAGSSGLNITNSLETPEFIAHYSGPRGFWERTVGRFPPRDWIRFIEEELGIATFEGTSRRYFVENMKASRMLQAWLKRLEAQGVELRSGTECVGVEAARGEGGAVTLTLRSAAGGGRAERAEGDARFDAACFCLGGGSWEPDEKPLRWPALFERAGVRFEPFRPANVGYEVAWPAGFLKEAEGKPFKRITLTTRRGSRGGELVVTRYGIEGTPVYFVGATGPARIDLKPDLSDRQIEERLGAVKENLSPIRRIQRQLKLDDAALALVFHLGKDAPGSPLRGGDLGAVARWLKAFPLELGAPRPLEEAISSAGGIALEELDDRMMIRRLPGVFAAGEMLDWDAPTGGFLIQACVAQGRAAAEGILGYLGRAPGTASG